MKYSTALMNTNAALMNTSAGVNCSNATLAPHRTWYSDGLEMRISALSFSAFSSSSTLSSTILTPSKRLGCCSNPAYENVFLKATPLISCESCRAPPCTWGEARAWVEVVASQTVDQSASQSFEQSTSQSGSQSVVE